MSKTWKPKTIVLPIDKMAGCPWNLLDARGVRVAWCGYDNDHERTGEPIANDLLNLVAIGEAAGELLEGAYAKQLAMQAEIDRLNRVVDRAIPIVREFTRNNPKFLSRMNGKQQDPLGAHAWLEAAEIARRGQ